MKHSLRDHIISAAITTAAVAGYLLAGSPGSARSAARLLFPIDVPAPAVQLCIWPGSDGTGGCKVDSTEVALLPLQRAQFYAAVLRADGVVDCALGTFDTTVLYNMVAVPFACDSAAALLDLTLAQDTINRITRFRWPRQAVATSYNIVVIQAWDLQAALDTLVLDTALVWTAGIVDSTYWVKGAARFLGTQAAFGDSTVFGFPSPVVLAPVQPIVVDTLP